MSQTANQIRLFACKQQDDSTQLDSTTLYNNDHLVEENKQRRRKRKRRRKEEEVEDSSTPLKPPEIKSPAHQLTRELGGFKDTKDIDHTFIIAANKLSSFKKLVKVFAFVLTFVLTFVLNKDPILVLIPSFYRFSALCYPMYREPEK